MTAMSRARSGTWSCSTRSTGAASSVAWLILVLHTRAPPWSGTGHSTCQQVETCVCACHLAHSPEPVSKLVPSIGVILLPPQARTIFACARCGLDRPHEQHLCFGNAGRQFAPLRIVARSWPHPVQHARNRPVAEGRSWAATRQPPGDDIPGSARIWTSWAGTPRRRGAAGDRPGSSATGCRSCPPAARGAAHPPGISPAGTRWTRTSAPSGCLPPAWGPQGAGHACMAFRANRSNTLAHVRLTIVPPLPSAHCCPRMEPDSRAGQARCKRSARVQGVMPGSPQGPPLDKLEQIVGLERLQVHAPGLHVLHQPGHFQEVTWFGRVLDVLLCPLGLCPIVLPETTLEVASAIVAQRGQSLTGIQAYLLSHGVWMLHMLDNGMQPCEGLTCPSTGPPGDGRLCKGRCCSCRRPDSDGWPYPEGVGIQVGRSAPAQLHCSAVDLAQRATACGGSFAESKGNFDGTCERSITCMAALCGCHHDHSNPCPLLTHR